MPSTAVFGQQPADQRRFPGAGRPGDADDVGPSTSGMGQSGDLLGLRPTSLDDREQSSDGAVVASDRTLDELGDTPDSGSSPPGRDDRRSNGLDHLGR